MTNYIYIATSLDGFIATSDGKIDWLNEIPNPENSDYGFAEFMNSIDALVMGRKSFEKVLPFDSWPYNKPVFVLSNTLTTLPENMADKAEIINGDLHDIIKKLNEQGYSKLYIDGGRTIQNFLKEDLIDEMIITKIPILLGKGIPLFGEIDQRLKFKHMRTEVFNNSLVMSYYSRDREV